MRDDGAVTVPAETSPPRSRETPRVVYVTSRPPYPPSDGFTIRNFHLLRAYARWATVQLVFLYQEDAELERAQALRAYCESLHPVQTRIPASPLSWPRRLRVIGTLRPPVATLLFSAQMARIVEELAASADVIHVTPLHMVAQVERLLASRHRRPRLVLDLPDVETGVRARRLRVIPHARLSRRLFGYYNLARTWAYQARAVRAFERVFVCSDRERDQLRSPQVLVVPNGAEVPEELPQNESDGRTVLFCGSLGYDANEDGLRFFLGRILPEIRRDIADVRLLIMGRQPPAWVRALDDGDRVVVEGDVPSVTEYYRRATISVVPLRVGGGTRIKILESWALGVPVVSTSVGCEGLAAVNGQHLLVADDPREFARSCVELLRVPALRQRLIEQGRDLVEQRYRWDAIALGAVATVRELLEGGPPSQ